MATSRRAGGGSDREAGGAAGARPRPPGGRIVFLRGAAAGVWAATGNLGLTDSTAPGNPDPSSIQLVRLSHLARAPTTDCEVGAVRGRCRPAALSIPLARISEQVPRSWDRAVGRLGGLGATSWSQASQVQEGPGRCQRAVCLAGGEVGRVGVRGGRRGCREPRHYTEAQGLGASADRASLSPVFWTGDRERG